MAGALQGWRSWALGAVGLIAALSASRVWLIQARWSGDPNEGWNAYQAMRALGAGPLYPTADALTGNNYPPLSFYLVCWLGRLVGDPIVAGRIVALLAMLAVAGWVFVLVRRLVGGNGGPLFAALLFLGYNTTLFRAYLAMNDPQWLAHALMAAGMVLLAPGSAAEAPSTRRAVASSLLMFVGGMVKHNLIAFPLAALVWLIWHHRRAARAWALSAAMWTGVAAVLCYRAYGMDFFVHLLAAPRHTSLVLMVLRSAPVVVLLLPLCLLVPALLRWRREDSRLDLLLLAAGIAVPLGIFQRFGQGVDINAHFESLIVLCAIAGVVAARSTQAPSWKQHPMRWVLAACALLVPAGAVMEWQEIADAPRAQAEWTEMQARIAATPGHVACDTLALCFWAGKPFELDFFLYGQRAAIDPAISHGTMPKALGRFAAIQIGPHRDAPRPGEIANPIIVFVEQNFEPLFADRTGRRLFVARNAR